MKRVSRKNRPCGLAGSISPERLEMQNADPSTSVTMPSAPMLALALVVQGSGIDEKLLPGFAPPSRRDRAPNVAGLAARGRLASAPDANRSRRPGVVPRASHRLRRHRARRVVA